MSTWSIWRSAAIRILSPLGGKCAMPEAPLETAELRESLEEARHHAQGHGGGHEGPGWMTALSLPTACIAAIALAAIAALSKKKPMWYVSLVGGAIRVFFFIQGFIPDHPRSGHGDQSGGHGDHGGAHGPPSSASAPAPEQHH